MTDQAAQRETGKEEIAILIRNMHKWYGDFHVLKDINLTVKRGNGLSSVVRRVAVNPL
ncbi:hypothetical protein GF1_32180 [Desulfolithobacter dissulfuricans]|uniref:ABC transporter ATP-binding protein n=1 Tax=Desulfolithobacter dissulfuricans TaxID=2795293 RepID=A0A915XL35_9BACT|nr:hypothetical protein [Desulfolithobacter dissulfuricans]BCO10842.1 hypothetical protein GF1_32180 [Desulfolithobacter dissulfuricans]